MLCLPPWFLLELRTAQTHCCGRFLRFVRTRFPTRLESPESWEACVGCLGTPLRESTIARPSDNFPNCPFGGQSRSIFEFPSISSLWVCIWLGDVRPIHRRCSRVGKSFGFAILFFPVYPPFILCFEWLARRRICTSEAPRPSKLTDRRWISQPRGTAVERPILRSTVHLLWDSNGCYHGFRWAAAWLWSFSKGGHIAGVDSPQWYGRYLYLGSSCFPKWHLARFCFFFWRPWKSLGRSIAAFDYLTISSSKSTQFCRLPPSVHLVAKH